MRDITVSQIKINNYRGLNNLSLDNLSNVNIFVGANNSGKTSVLEALRILAAPNDESSVIRLALLRRGTSGRSNRRNLVNYLLSIFQVADDDDKHYHIGMEAVINNQKCSYNVDGTIGEYSDLTSGKNQTFDMGIRISIDGKSKYHICTIENGKDYKFVPNEEPLYNCLYFHSSVNYYTSCVNMLTDHIIREGKNDVLRMLKSFDKNIEDISIVGEDVYLTNKFSGSLPLFAYGLGMQKAVLLTLSLMRCKDGVILIDEIDNAIHISVFKDVFRWFIEACIEYNVQAFVTTHSAEALDEILKVSHNMNYDRNIRVVTLRKNYDNNETYCRIRTGEEAYEDRKMFEMELRV